MIFAKLLKSFLFSSLILAIAIPVQPSCAMEDQIDGNQKSLQALRKRKVLSVIDQNQSSEEKNELSFFIVLPDEIVLKVISHLCEGERSLENLNSFARTCRKGKTFSENSQLFKTLKNTYFGHLPVEYLSKLMKDAKLPPLSQTHFLMQQLLSFQSEEIEQLKRIFSEGYYTPVIWGDYSHGLVRNLKTEFKGKLLTQLKECEKANISKYFNREEILDRINTLVIKECLNHITTQPRIRSTANGWNPYKVYNFNLKGAITRLPLEGIHLIKDKAHFVNADIELSLACNGLRWLPDELFSISRMMTLDIRNNLLLDLPPSIEFVKQDLESLFLGNFKPLGDICECCDFWGRRTSGNLFKTIPPAILKLNNLERLEISSVELEKFSEEEVYTSLPKLSYINLNHNNLPEVPEPTFKTRIIEVQRIGNLADGLFTSDMNVWNYRLSKYCTAPLSRILFYTSYISVPAVLGVIWSLYHYDHL